MLCLPLIDAIWHVPSTLTVTITFVYNNLLIKGIPEHKEQSFKVYSICLWSITYNCSEVILLFKSNAHYSKIMLKCFHGLLFPKLCWHIRLSPTNNSCTCTCWCSLYSGTLLNWHPSMADTCIITDILKVLTTSP